MKKESLYKLIAESKPLLKHATPQQKLRLLKLIRENLKVKKQIVENFNNDYLEEK